MASKPLAINGIRALQNLLPIIARGAMDETMRAAEDEAKRTTAFKNYTGRLRASIRGGIQDTSPTRITGVLTAGADDASSTPGWETPSRTYSVHVELGMARRPPHAFIAPTMRTIASQGLLGRALQHRFIGMLSKGTW